MLPTSKVVKLHENQGRKLQRSTSLPAVLSNMSSHQTDESLDEGRSRESKEKARVTFSFDPQAASRFEWLREVEVTEPRYFAERKTRRMFLEKVRASQKQGRKLVGATSLPLPRNVGNQTAGSLNQGAISNQKSRGRVSSESEALRFEWLREVEVTEPKYFIERKNRRKFLEKVRISNGSPKMD